MTHIWDKQFKGILAYPDCADEYLELICEIAIDYDGYSTTKGLESLIDEMAEYAQKARKCLREHKIFTDKEATEASFNAAQDDYEAWLKAQSKLQKAILIARCKVCSHHLAVHNGTAYCPICNKELTGEEITYEKANLDGRLI